MGFVHVVSGLLASGQRAEPLTPVQVPVQLVVVSADDGGRRARVTPEQFAQWVAFANSAFRDAGVHFVFDAQDGVDELRDTALNDTAGAADASWPVVKAHGNELAAGYPDRLVVFVRHGPGAAATGAAFAGVDHDFVVMGGFDDMSHCGHPHLDALAHEIGHYLGLPHTFVGEPFRDIAEAEAHLEAHGGDPLAFDGDGFTDTPPDPCIRPFECERRQQVVLNGQAFVLPRRNLMSYYDERATLTPQQIEHARWVLEHRRRNHMRMPANAPGRAALEAEALAIVGAEACSASVQAMDAFGAGGWSGGEQLFCGSERGAVLTLTLSVKRPDTYDVVLYATLAPDFGVVQCAVNGTPHGQPVDLYAPIVLPTGALSLGRVLLPAGTHRVAFEVLGKHPASKGYHFGIDALELLD